MRFQLIHVAVFPFQSEAKIVLTSSIVSLIELLCVFCWYYVTVDYVVIILSSVLVQRILFIHLMIYILLKITQYAFDRRTIGADRREYGQNPRRHDGRRESVEWNGKMLWNLRTPVEKVRFYFRIALNSFYKKKNIPAEIMRSKKTRVLGKGKAMAKSWTTNRSVWWWMVSKWCHRVTSESKYHITTINRNKRPFVTNQLHRLLKNIE